MVADDCEGVWWIGGGGGEKLVTGQRAFLIQIIALSSHLFCKNGACGCSTAL